MRAALPNWWGMYYEDILRYCMFRLSDRYLRRDAVQETFLKVFRYLTTTGIKADFELFCIKWREIPVST